MSNARAAVALGRPAADASEGSFLTDCQEGMRQARKAIPCKWLYDDEGSRLFELICQTPEYYPSRAESALLAEVAPVIADLLTPDTALIEFGSGASRKTRILLDVIDQITSYVPIDINPVELTRAAAAIGGDYPWLELFPIAGDFTKTLDLGPALMFAERFGFFPGSTLGNFTPEGAINFLRTTRQMLGSDGRLLIGVDLVKDAQTLLAAYDDRGGVTAAFNLNLLSRMNRELGADIDLSAFDHRAMWNVSETRVEMHLVCRADQHIILGGERFTIRTGETIHTENSRKFKPDELARMFAASGWTTEMQWISGEPSFALTLLRG